MIVLSYSLIVPALTSWYPYGMLFYKLLCSLYQYHKGERQYANYTRTEAEARMVTRILSSLCRCWEQYYLTSRGGRGHQEGECHRHLQRVGRCAGSGRGNQFVFSRASAKPEAGIEKPRFSGELSAAFNHLTEHTSEGSITHDSNWLQRHDLYI